MQKIEALVSDLDDTLLTDQHQMTSRTIRTLKRLQRQGVKVILASGRSAASIRPFVRAIETTQPYIAFNGAQIVSAQTDEVLYNREIPLPLAKDMLAWLEKKAVYALYYAGDHWFYTGTGGIAEDYGRSTGIPGTRVEAPLSASINVGTPKLLAISEPDHIQELISEARPLFGDCLYITTSKPIFMEITLPGSTKGDAVRALAEMIGLSPDTTICAGDSLNDLSMLEWSRLPVAVSNAREQVRRVAWKIAGDGHEDGIAALMDELVPEVNVSC